MRCYKVVHCHKGLYTSTYGQILHPQHVLTYEIVKTTFPVIGKIFVFEDLENAIQFQDRFIPVFSRIFIGEGTNIQHDGGAIRLSIYDTEVNKELVIDFWKEYPRLGYLIHVPKGTVFCDSFTPERIVHP